MTTQQQQRRHLTCHRHPTKPSTGLCAACLRERLSGIDPDTHQETPITHLSSELRRTRSHSSTTTTTTATDPNAASSSSSNTTTTTLTGVVSEPRRKSCDIKCHNSLSDLFVIDDDKTRRRRRTSKSLHLGSELMEEEENVVGEVKENPNPRVVLHMGDDFEDGSGADLKPMKEFIDLEFDTKSQHHKFKDFKVIAGTIWGAASGFSKRFGVLPRNQKMRKKNELVKGGGGMKLREVQSEVGEYGFLGRRSCDTDPRLSVDDSRHSFECVPGRVSWDGCLIGGRTYPKLMPLVSVIEDAKLGNEGVEDLQTDGEGSPGGTTQTREYYSDGRRRKSFDRSGLNKRVGSVDDELKSMWNAKVSPEGVGLFHGAKLLVTEKELRDSNWYSVKDDVADSVASVTNNVTVQPNKAKGSRNMWNLWGFMQKKRRNNGGHDDQSTVATNVANGARDVAISQKLIRSYTLSTGSPGLASNGIETKVNGTKGSEDLMLQRYRSVRYSPNTFDSGLLRFYLTPSRNYGRSKSARNSLSIARNDL